MRPGRKKISKGNIFDNNMKSKNVEAIMDDDYEFDDDDDINHDVCAICDNGGDLTYCDGKCLRAFHATVESARSAKSYCTSLNLRAEEVKGSQQFICLNCSHEQHQCFVCKELGSSNISSGAEVFCCSLATCGHFYHPQCVAQLLKDEKDYEALELEESIAAGEPFTCPAHKCHSCEQEENEKVEGLQFAICRRCPTSYHRKCLPKKILFDSEDSDDVIRAWNDLLPKSRALIFCLKHKMDKRLQTAKRNIKFPEIDHSKKNEEDVNSDYTSDGERKLKKSSSRKRVRTRKVNKSPSRKRVRMSSQSEAMKKRLKNNLSVDMKSDSKMDHILVDKDEQTPTATPMEAEDGSFTTTLDADSRERILALVNTVRSSVTKDNLKIPEVEESNEAVHLAIKKLEEGCSVEDALADCEPGDLDQLWKFKDKLKAYLGPFLDDEMVPTEVENCELNCEVSMETTGKAAASVISQKETPQCNNDKTRPEVKVDGQKEKHISCLPQQSDFEITPTNYNNTRSGFYRDLSGFDTRPYIPSEHLNSSVGWLDE